MGKALHHFQEQAGDQNSKTIRTSLNYNMRILAEIPHPECKITIFSMNQKFIIKFERSIYEQTYKLSELDISEGVEGVFKIVDHLFITTVINRFIQMKSDFNSALTRFEDL